MRCGICQQARGVAHQVHDGLLLPSVARSNLPQRNQTGPAAVEQAKLVDMLHRAASTGIHGFWNDRPLTKAWNQLPTQRACLPRYSVRSLHDCGRPLPQSSCTAQRQRPHLCIHELSKDSPRYSQRVMKALCDFIANTWRILIIKPARCTVGGPMCLRNRSKSDAPFPAMFHKFCRHQIKHVLPCSDDTGARNEPQDFKQSGHCSDIKHMLALCALMSPQCRTPSRSGEFAAFLSALAGGPTTVC